MIDIMIVDDHAIVREGLSRIIVEAGRGKYKIVGMVDSFDDALRAIRDSHPDVLIVDIFLNGSDGIELTKCIKAQENTDGINILVLSMHDEALYAERALHAGANGYIMKHESATELCNAIDTVAKGEVYLSREMTARLLRARTGKSDDKTTLLASLSDRELEVLGLLGTGLTTNEISEELSLSVKTVETYCARIKEKLGLTNFNQLMLHAVQWTHSNHGNVKR